MINWVSETRSTTYTKLRIKGEALGQLRAWESRSELSLSCSTEVCDKITALLSLNFYGGRQRDIFPSRLKKRIKVCYKSVVL